MKGPGICRTPGSNAKGHLLRPLWTLWVQVWEGELLGEKCCWVHECCRLETNQQD